DVVAAPVLLVRILARDHVLERAVLRLLRVNPPRRGAAEAARAAAKGDDRSRDRAGHHDDHHRQCDPRTAPQRGDHVSSKGETISSQSRRFGPGAWAREAHAPEYESERATAA